MVDRANEQKIRFFNAQEELAQVTMTAHEHMQANRGEPMRAPVSDCPDCDGTGVVIERGQRLYCTCMYEEYEL